MNNDGLLAIHFIFMWTHTTKELSLSLTVIVNYHIYLMLVVVNWYSYYVIVSTIILGDGDS